jgi:hypothetical protein
MHGNVGQESLYQICSFHDLWGRGSTLRAGLNLVYRGLRVNYIENILHNVIDSKLKLNAYLE